METQPTTHERLIAARREIFNLNAGINPDLFISPSKTKTVNNHYNTLAQIVRRQTETTILLDSYCKDFYTKMKNASKEIIVANPTASSKL